MNDEWSQAVRLYNGVDNWHLYIYPQETYTKQMQSKKEKTKKRQKKKQWISVIND